jgi:hypothetical protein
MQQERVKIIRSNEKISVPKNSLRTARRLLKNIEKSNQEDKRWHNFSKKSLLKIIEYCEHHKHHEQNTNLKSLVFVDLKENKVEKWDIDFLDFNDVDELSDLIVLAKLLEIEELVNLACAKFANLIKFRGLQVFEKSE